MLKLLNRQRLRLLVLGSECVDLDTPVIDSLLPSRVTVKANASPACKEAVKLF